MKYKIIIVLLLTVAYGRGYCQDVVSFVENSKTVSLRGENGGADTLSVLIAKIEFGLKATKEERETFDDGIVPWISIDNPGKGLDSLVAPDQVVLPFPKVILQVDYPLTKPASFTITSKDGLSRKQLIKVISEIYHQIYTEEESTATIKTLPPDKRGDSLNRNATNGKYGIEDHDLSDLDLSAIEARQTSDGTVYLVLVVES